MMILSTATPSDLSRAITNADWSTAIQLVKANPEQAKRKVKRQGFFDGRTCSTLYPLHEALVAKEAPLECIQAIVEAYPAALSKPESSYDRLPLHCACRKNADNPALIEYLLTKHKQACVMVDALGRLPIHYALTNGANPHVISLFLQIDPASVRASDYMGWTPVHVAVSVGLSPRLVEAMLKAFPEAVLLKTNKNSSMKHVIPHNNPNQNEYVRLIEETHKAVMLTTHLPSLRQNSMRSSRLIMV